MPPRSSCFTDPIVLGRKPNTHLRNVLKNVVGEPVALLFLGGFDAVEGYALPCGHASSGAAYGGQRMRKEF